VVSVAAGPTRCALALALLGPACSRPASEPGAGATPAPLEASPAPSAAPPAAEASAPAASAAPAARPPLARGPFAALPVEGYAEAVVSLPSGATGPRPVLVAAHGNYDTPEWQCRVWREAVGARGFVLCPRGVPRRDSPSRDDVRYEYASGAALERELDAALAALGRAYEGYVDGEAIVYTGFSLGANMGSAIIRKRPGRFPRAVLIEGGSTWAPGAAAAYAKGGGARVLWACGQPGCVQASERSAASFVKAGGEARVVYAKGAGHTYDGPVAERVRGAFDWLVEGDGRWSGGAAPE
jgi:predicted esterase